MPRQLLTPYIRKLNPNFWKCVEQFGFGMKLYRDVMFDAPLFLYVASYAMLPISAGGEAVPDTRPNKGSVKNRNHQMRMPQRAEFAKVRC